MLKFTEKNGRKNKLRSHGGERSFYLVDDHNFWAVDGDEVSAFIFGGVSNEKSGNVLVNAR